MIKFKIGDTVKVTLGKDRGREGKIEFIDTKDRTVVIPQVNIYKKHVKGQGTKEGQKGGIYELPRPLPFSKISLLCPKCKKVTRVAFRMVEKDKVRICAKCRKEIDSK